MALAFVPWLALPGALFLVLVAALHVLKPELRPARHMISEYAVGRHGWTMQAAFGCLATSCLWTAAVAWQVPGARAGAVLLAVAGVGALGVGLWVTDPPGPDPGAATPAGLLHLVFSLVLIPVLPLAASLLGAAAAADPALPAVRWALPWMAALCWIGLAGFVGALVHWLRGQRAGPAPAGYAQRLMVLAYAVFLVLTAVVLQGAR